MAPATVPPPEPEAGRSGTVTLPGGEAERVALARAVVLVDGQTLDLPARPARPRDRGQRGFTAPRPRLLAEPGVV